METGLYNVLTSIFYNVKSDLENNISIISETCCGFRKGYIIYVPTYIFNDVCYIIYIILYVKMKLTNPDSGSIYLNFVHNNIIG